jgi:hypothetical protein
LGTLEKFHPSRSSSSRLWKGGDSKLRSSPLQVSNSETIESCLRLLETKRFHNVNASMVTAACLRNILNSCSYQDSASFIIPWKTTTNNAPFSHTP